MGLRFKVHSRKDRLTVPGAPPSVAEPMPTSNDPAEWKITTQDVEDLRAEAARLPAEIRALQSRLALVRRKLDAVEYLLADKAKREGAEHTALPSPPSPG